MNRLVFLLVLLSVSLTTAKAQQDTTTVDNQQPNALANLDQLPEYRFGLEGLMQYFNKHLAYPKEAKKKGVEGTVYVSFLVDSTGALRDFVVKEGVGYGCDEEAIRLLKGTSPWLPAQQEGKAIAMRYVMPVRFARKK